MYLNAPKLSLLSAMIVASIGVALLPHEARAATTLETIIQGNVPSPQGYQTLVAGPNPSGRVVRTLDGSDAPANLTDSFSVLAFGHMSDTQICDDQSPSRVPFLDKLADIDPDWHTQSAYRPQERLLPQMAAAMVSSLRNVGAAPQTGLPLAFTLITGDMVDNAQFNETRTYIDLLDGGTIRPNHWLNPSVEEGPGYGGNNTRHKFNLPNWSGYLLKPNAYYHPNPTGDGDPNSPNDFYRQRGFPIIPALLNASRQNFTSPGLGMPWYAAFGNHDMSIQGNLPPERLDAFGGLGAQLKNFATGDKRVREIEGLPWEVPEGTSDWVAAAASALLDVWSDPVRAVAATPDPNRLILDKGQFMDEHFVTNGLPVGHGFKGDGKPYYVVPSSGPNDRFKFIALDTTNSTGHGPRGWIDPEQWTWLLQELRSASSREWSSNGEWVLRPNVKDKLIVLYGHHPLDKMDNITKDDDGLPMGYSGAELKEMLLHFPNVIMVLNGHNHGNKIRAHSVSRTSGPDQWKSNGFYEITSPAAADWPVQSRLIEVAMGTTGDANGSQNNNYVSIYTTMLDVDAPVQVAYTDSLSDYKKLASVGRELAFNESGNLVSGNGKGGGTGSESDRNTQLILPTPFPMNDFPRAPTTDVAVHIITQKADTKDAKIVRMLNNGTFSGTIEDFSASSLQESEIIGTGTFTQGVKGRNLGNDLVLRDSAGNIRIKLLGADLKEVAYPGFGAEIRGSVASDSQLAGIDDFDWDGRDDLIWRHSNGTVELWPAGSVIDRKYLNASNDYASPAPEPGSEQRKIVAVGDFNADGSADLLWENLSDHSRFIRYMQGIARTSDVSTGTYNYYANGYDLYPGVGRSTVPTGAEQVLYRKVRNLDGSSADRSIVIDAPKVGSRVVYFQNQFGWNPGLDWMPVNLGDFNVDGIHDILWRHDNGLFAIWFLREAPNYFPFSYPFISNNDFSVGLGPEWAVKGVLKNTVTVIY